MTTAPRKKLIEVSIPLEAINKASAREKSIRHGHPSTLHLWWARRPLAACRAVLFAQLVDDPSSWPEKFGHDEEKIEAERRRLHKVIEEMVPWEASNDEHILNGARWEIARSVAWGLGEEPPAKSDGKALLAYLQEKAPPVYDPFSGGGSIPLEAQRLGLRAYGSDLNPVAVLIGKALVEIPPKFAGLPPVNPKSQAELKRGGRWNGRGAQGLAEDVRYYGRWMRDEAEKRIGHFYPKTKLEDGSEATVIAWLWARTVRSPDPAAKGAMVPLVSSFMLSTKEGKKAWVEPVLDPAEPDGWRFEVKTGKLDKADEDRLKLGTKAGKGQGFVCLLTGSTIERSYAQAEGKSDRLGSKLMAVIMEGDRRRIYLAPATADEQLARSAGAYPVVSEARASFLSPETPTRALITGGVCSAYGLRTWGHLFTDRQILALVTLNKLVEEARQVVGSDAKNVGALADANGYADAVATYLALSASRQVNRSCTLNFWDNTSQKIQQVFGRQAFAMTWDFVETNIFSNSTGNFLDQLEFPAKSIESWVNGTSQCYIEQLDAAKNNYPVRPVVVSTDPPYYDNIGYATLSDFFYVWLRVSLGGIWPDLFRRLTTPKDQELVATPFRHGGKAEAEAFFMKGIGNALIAIRGAATNDVPIAIYYAFKQSEASDDGISSAGWASFLQGVVDAGLLIDGTWPVRTELTGNLKGKINALASSIVLVCRKRSDTSQTVDRAGFTAALRRELPDAIAKIRAAGVGPVDMQQSVIGPGMGVFTRFSEVLEDDDSAMSVKTALSVINRVWEEIDNEILATFDAETQVALAWFASYGLDPRSSGELIMLANAKNTSTDALFDSEVFIDLRGKTALKPRDELSPSWSPRKDRRLTVWECVQHTARALDLKNEQGGAQAAAQLVAEMGPKATDARALLDRLFQIATDKGWAAEALVYNQLAEEWPHLVDRAANISDELKPTEMGDLFA